MKWRELIYERPVKGAETLKREEKDDASKLTMFDFLKQITSKSRKFPYDKKIAPAYMLSLWLSQESSFIDIVNRINKRQFGMSDEMIYEYYMREIPKGNKFIRWTKKDTSDLKIQKEVQKLLEETDLSSREAEMVVRFKERLFNEC